MRQQEGTEREVVVRAADGFTRHLGPRQPEARP